MSQLSAIIKSWFTKDILKKIIILGREILTTIIGDAGHNLSKIALEEVNKAEKTVGSGRDKFRVAFLGIKKRLPEIEDKAINLAIELAVSALT